jgi:membrane protease YdiL (CAAX protease family)
MPGAELTGADMRDERSLVNRILKLIGIGVLALAITGLAGAIWTVLLIANLRSNPTIPWSVPLMAALLWIFWSYLGGKGWPQSTSEARRRYLRANWASRRTFVWALIAGLLSVVALAGYWIVFFRLVKMQPNAIPDTSSYPRLTVALMILMGSMVAPFMEEASIRGYLQVALEHEFRGPVAVMISSVVFVVAHLAHGFVWPKLLFYFLVGIAFGATAYLTNSTLPAILPHAIGDITFFTLIWPHDATRRLISEGGTDNLFWIHVGQAVIFTVLSVWAFARLATVSRQDSTSGTTTFRLQKVAAS